MNKIPKIVGLLLSVGIIAGVIWAVFHTRDILDYVALRGYNPPVRVVELARDTSMKDNARKVFYVNHPDIQNKASFTGSCTTQEQTIVLGCFVSNKGIYLLDVTDQRLQGIVQVTAAHETLHGLYDRLSDAERQKVDSMTANFYASITNTRIKENIDNYRKRDPTVVPNELHSILGTEVKDLSPELESYYSQYFSDRKSIVAYSEKYEQTFIDIENQVKQYQDQLTGLKAALDTNEKQLEESGRNIDQERKRLDQLRASGKTNEYNGGVESFNALVNRYNSLIAARQSQINQYNRLVELYNSLANTEKDLVQSLKSTPEQAQTTVPN